MSKTLDNALALRVLWILITPFNQSDAFKLGLIDAEGKALKKPKTSKEQAAYSMLHRLVFRLKRVLGVLPFGKTNFASYAAAYQLVKESMDADGESFNEHIEELYISLLNEINSNQDLILEKKEIKKLFDDVAGNSVAGVDGYDAPIAIKKVPSKSVFKRIRKEKNTVYKVNEDLFFVESNTKILDKIYHLKNLIQKHSDISKNGDYANRTYKWMAEYDKIKDTYPEEWIEYCNQTNSAEDHQARDLLA